MPIRTPRGRSAAYRAIWQWPLRSPARLAGFMVIALAVAVGITVAVTALSGPRAPGIFDPARNQPTATPSAGGPSAGGPTTGGPSGGGPSTAGPVAPPSAATSAPSPLPLDEAPQEALDVAERWAKAWVRPREGTTAEQWLRGLEPLTTESYLGVLNGIDPENIPATRVTGEPEPVRVADRNVQVQVATDALTLRLLLVDTDAGWRVAGYERI